MGSVGIKFKEFVYIYNFTCFELIGMDLKSHGKCRNQKKFSIVYIRLIQCRIARVEFNEVGKYYLSPHLSNINQVMENVGIKFKEFVYIYNLTHFELIQMNLKSYEKCRDQKNFSIFYIRLTSM